MDVYECIKTRRSIRRYMDKPVEWEKIGILLDAGKSAPSSGNLQNWKFIVVTEQDTRAKIAEICGNQTWMTEAPVHIVIMNNFNKCEQFYGMRGERLYSIQNCAAATENILLMAHAIGLGSCWIGYFDEDELNSIMNIPKFGRAQAVITIGYAAEEPPCPPKYTLENVMFFRTWGGQGPRISNIPRYRGEFSYLIKDAMDYGKKVADKLNKKLQK